MRRNTQKPSKSPLPAFQNRRQTYIQSEFNRLESQQQSKIMKTGLVDSQIIVRDFIQEGLLDRFKEEFNQKELRRIVNGTMSQCINLLQNENWQNDPNGSFIQRLKEVEINTHEELQVKAFDPIMRFGKPKRQKIQKIVKIQTQTSMQFSRLKFYSQPKEQKSNYIKTMSKASIPTHRSIMSKQNSRNNISKLIPLKLDYIFRTPEGSRRRNLEDFLREKKINDEINLGYKIKYFDQKENQNLKTIQEFRKSSFLFTSQKNETLLGQNSLKLPLIFNYKEDFGTDYDGGCIPIKKVSNLKKSTQILKPVYNIKHQNENTKKERSQKIKIQKLKFRPLTLRNQSINLSQFSAKISREEDLKKMIEKNFFTNRIKFREIDPNDVTIVYE